MSARLEIAPEAAHRAARACEVLIQRLEDAIDRIDGRDFSGALGDIPSGQALATKYQAKLDGDKNSMVSAIESHIKVIDEMYGKFFKIARGYELTEEESIRLFGR